MTSGSGSLTGLLRAQGSPWGRLHRGKGRRRRACGSACLDWSTDTPPRSNGTSGRTSCRTVQAIGDLWRPRLEGIGRYSSAPMDPREDEKRAAARAAALEVEDGMLVGLGTGSTVAHFLPALAGRGLTITCVATSPATEEAARALGLTVQSFDLVAELDIAVDGA